MLSTMRKRPKPSISARTCGTIAWTLTYGAMLLAPLPAHAWQQGQQKGMAGMEKSGDPNMSVMGQSMAAMANHMYITPLRAKQPGDEQKAKAVVAEVKAAIERYQDYRRALADGYIVANPKVDQPQYHFNNEANVREADSHFDPRKPSSLLYFRTPTQRYKLEGVMYTDRPNATEDELNQRIPLSIARWHEHTNFCEAPADRVREYLGAHPKFGMFGSIHTKEACEAEKGIFHPLVFSWMIHVFPYETDIKSIFSMNDDIAHVH